VILDGIATTLAIIFARYAAIAGFREFAVIRDARRAGLDTGTFNYGIDVGFSYRFGSIFNNVVNNRFASFIAF